MAGHETALVTPKGYIQDPLKIAAGSPLAIQGIFLEILRERFRTDAGLEMFWDPDPTITDILIEASYNEETQSRNQTPAVYVTRTQTVPGRTILGDRAGVRLPDHLEGFGALTTVGISVECVSNDEGESAVIGDIVQYMLLASQDVVQRSFGFYDMSHPSLEATTIYPRDVNKWSTSVDFTVQFWIRWSQVPIAPLLQQLYQRVSLEGNPDFFSESALTSLQRGQPPVIDSPAVPVVGPVIPTTSIGNALRSGLLSVSTLLNAVAVPGPQGPAGPVGVAGATGPAGPTGGTDFADHEILDTVTHELVEDSYDQIIYTGLLVNEIVTWTSAAMLLRVRAKQFTYIGNNISQIDTIQYDATGVELYRVQEVYTYVVGNVTAVTRTRI